MRMMLGKFMSPVCECFQAIVNVNGFGSSIDGTIRNCANESSFQNSFCSLVVFVVEDSMMASHW